MAGSEGAKAMTLLTTLKDLAAKATPGELIVIEDPCDDRDYKTLVALKGPPRSNPTWIMRAEHNWNYAGDGERRISWKEAEINAAITALLFNARPEIIAMMEREEAREVELAAVKAERDGLREALGPAQEALTYIEAASDCEQSRKTAAETLAEIGIALKGTVG